MNSTPKRATVSVLTQVVLCDEPGAGGAPVVAPELDPELLADGDVGGDGAAAKVSEEGATRAPRVHRHIVAVAVV